MGLYISNRRTKIIMSFIENAKKLKKEKGYTTNELSKLCGIPLGTLSKLFSGIIEEPKLSAAVAISKSPGTTVDALCEITDGTYTSEERDIIAKYRMLDPHAKKLVDLVISNEMARLDVQIQNMTEQNNKASSKEEKAPDIKPDVQERKDPEKKEKETPVLTQSPTEVAIRTLPLYSSALSVGIAEPESNIRVKNTGRVTEASYALKVEGDSMMPEYAEGDILIIKEQDTVTNGELCIYICDGKSYFRKYATDKLISLNPDCEDVSLSDFTTSACVGLVLGRLRSKKN